MTLWDLRVGQNAIVDSISSALGQQHQRRLNEIGFDSGEEVLCLRRSPFGGPAIFQVGQTVFGLDRELALAVHLLQKEG